MEAKNIYEAILNVMKEVGYVQKEKKPGLNYTYAGEAALIAALRPAMVENGILMYVKEVRNKTWQIYQTTKGSNMIDTGLELVVVFHHVPSGTEIGVMAPGEGSDTGDKSGNKAATGAYKYALRQTFMIETGDDPDQFASESIKNDKKGGVILTENKERIWSLDQMDAVLEHTAGITDSHEGAKEILDASVLPEEVSVKTIESWVKHYTKAWEGKSDKMFAASTANEAYMKAKKGGK